jgi:sugar phosphate isomerase/epimerase
MQSRYHQEKAMQLSMDRRLFLKTTGSIAAVACGTTALRPLMASAAPGSSAAEKIGWRLGSCAYSFNQLTFYETIDKVASLGLKHVVGFNWQKLDPRKPGALFCENMSVTERRETKKRLDDAGVKIPCCYCNTFGTIEACRRLFEFAREMGMETLDGEPPTETFDIFEPLCDEYCINVAVHNHAKPSPNWKPETLLKLFHGRSKRIGACCDTGHWARSGLNPIETLQKLQGRILTFDLKDVNEKGVCVPFGTGKGDIRGILQELYRQRFQGVFGIEYDDHATDIEKDIAQCMAYFNKTAESLTRPNGG